MRARAAALCLFLLAPPATATAREPRPVRQVAPPGAAGPGPGQRANAAIALEDLHEALRPLGEWAIHPTWGPVWKPAGVGTDWRPYHQGRWAHTAQGWYWVSDEPWGWATYHFGRWYLDAAAGWVWVPGRRWAPSWVVWREGKGLVGWAPLGPNGHESPLTWTFVPKEKLGEEAPKVELPPARGGHALQVTRRIERDAPAPRPAPVPPAPPARPSTVAHAGP
jgi:hypothetical protein